MSGGVVKAIAEKVYANHTTLDIREVERDSLAVMQPRVKAGERLALNEVLDELDVRIENDDVDAGWVSAAVDGSLQMLKMKALPLREGLVPNVVGMGAKDAVYLLERAGMRVSLSGMGRVSAQSVRPGTRITKGRTVSLTLK